MRLPARVPVPALPWVLRLAFTLGFASSVLAGGGDDSTPPDASAPLPPDDGRAPEVTARVGPDLRARVEAAGFRWGASAYLRIFKESSELEVWLEHGDAYALFATYPICRWSGELGPKTREGDGQCPEGFYRVTADAMNPWSEYHLSFNLGYPNSLEHRMGWTGSALMVHGDCVSIGCYAMTDAGIEQIYLLVDAALRAGAPHVPVHALPFRMEPERVREAEGTHWYGYWRFQLFPVYEAFERDKLPPRVDVSAGRYTLTE